MSRGRLILAGVVAVIVLALIFGAISNGQRDAWTQGYLVGRLTAVKGADTLAAVGLLMYFNPRYGASPELVEGTRQTGQFISPDTFVPDPGLLMDTIAMGRHGAIP